MNLPWSPVIFVDMFGSVLMLILSTWCAVHAWRLARAKPGDAFRSYIFLFTLAILFFAVSRSFGHLIKQLLLLSDMEAVWQQISPFSGAINSTAFVVIFAFGISFHRFQKVHAEIEYYQDNLEKMIATRTAELERANNTLENILNNSSPINITAVNFDLLRANSAYYAFWPRTRAEEGRGKCYESRPGDHCHTEACPLRQIVAGAEEVRQEVSKQLDGEARHFMLTAKPFRDVDGALIGMVESFQDITLLKQAETALRESEERFRLIFESNPDPVILAELADGAICDVNRAFEAAAGIPRGEAIGHNVAELGLWVTQGQREQFRELLREQGEVNNFEAVFRVHAGQEKTGLISARRLKVNDQLYSLTVIRDITKEKAAERALVEMDRMKSEFISTAAHELSTPLSAILGYVELLQQPDEYGGFTEEQKRDFINEVHDRGEALNRVIADLLDISRIESGNPIPLILKETDLGEVLRRKHRLFQTQYPGRSFRLELPARPARPVVVMDRHRIEQALDNLLSNAVKYSAKGTEIVLRGCELADGWEVRIEDHGIGMTADQLSRVFDKFYRADASNTAASGLGLGMSIVRQVIAAHSGGIRVESVVGEGTTAIFTLPLIARPKPPALGE